MKRERTERQDYTLLHNYGLDTLNHCHYYLNNFIFFSLSNRPFYCYLKQTDSGKPKIQNPLLKVTSGYSRKPCRCVAPASCFDQTYPNVDFPGADYRSLFTADSTECQRACTQDPGCQFFTWVNTLFSNEKIR